MSLPSSSHPAVALIRHGQTDWNAAGRLQGQVDIPLNEVGREQAREAARSLEGDGWEKVVASPLGRAFETASIIARHLGLPEPTTDEGLIERGYGELEGAVDAELPAETRRVLHPGHGADPEPIEEVGYRLGLLPGVEHSKDCAARGVDAVRRIVAAHPGERVLMVAHGTIIRLTLDALDDWKVFHPSPRNAEVLVLDDAQLAAAHASPVVGS